MNFLQAWTQHREHPGKQAEAAMRATITAERRVAEEAHNLQSALARGDKTAAEAARKALRQAWETDVRRKGGHPEDYIPDLPHADVVPIFHTFHGYGKTKKKLGGLLLLGLVGFWAIKKLTS